MPPKRVEDQPVINPAHGEETSNASAPKKRKETRATHGEKLRRLVESKGKISLTFRKIDGRPVGSHRAEFATEVGVAVKKFAPLQMLSWRHVSEEQKQPIYDRLSEMFDVDLGTGPESFRKETNKMMSARYRDLRTRMHDYYKKFAHLPWDDRVKQMPEKLCDCQEDWKYLCRLFETDEFKTRSKKNSANRAKMPYNHRAGSKPFLQYYYGDGDDPSYKKDRISLFEETHYNNEKGWIGEKAESVYREMVQLRDEIRESECEADFGDDGQNADDVEIADRVCDQILGHRAGGYIRGLGNGPKLPSSYVGASSSRPTNAQLKEKLENTQNELQSTQNELHNTQNELQSTKTKLQTVESKLEAMFRAFDSIAPGVMASFLQPHPSSSAQPPPTPNF